MTNAFLWHMIGVDRFMMEGRARSIVLYDKTVILVDGIKPDFDIHLSGWDSAEVAQGVAVLETITVEQRGLEVCSVYGLRGLGNGFKTKVAAAHRLYLARQWEALESSVADIVFQIQRDGEELDA